MEEALGGNLGPDAAARLNRRLRERPECVGEFVRQAKVQCMIARHPEALQLTVPAPRGRLPAWLRRAAFGRKAAPAASAGSTSAVAVPVVQVAAMNVAAELVQKKEVIVTKVETNAAAAAVKKKSDAPAARATGRRTGA